MTRCNCGEMIRYGSFFDDDGDEHEYGKCPKCGIVEFDENEVKPKEKNEIEEASE
jgi:hypothetical protein